MLRTIAKWQLFFHFFNARGKTILSFLKAVFVLWDGKTLSSKKRVPCADSATLFGL